VIHVNSVLRGRYEIFGQAVDARGLELCTLLLLSYMLVGCALARELDLLVCSVVHVVNSVS
jgi:hypothetical protein